MSYQENEPLFTKSNLRDALDQHHARLQEKVDEIPRSQFQVSSDQQLFEHIYQTFVVTPITLHEERVTMEEPQDTFVDVSGWSNYMTFGDVPTHVKGVRVSVFIPYTGDDALWKWSPDPMWSIAARGNVVSAEEGGHGTLNIIISQPNQEPLARVRETLEDMLRPIRQALDAQKREIDSRNARLDDAIRAAIAARRKELGRHEQIPNALGIPLRHKPGAPPIVPIRAEKRFPKPLPQVTAATPEPGIADDYYDYILKVVRHVGCTFESTPATYRVHDEEELRDIMLAHLNGHFEGDATGETFRKRGKTDIRIEDNNRAAFVAECKVWGGAGEIGEAIDQLQSYLTWRDCKASLIIFNKKNARFAHLQAKAPEVFRNHQGFQSEEPSGAAGEWKFVIESREDPQRLIRVHVFLFNLFAAE